MKILAFSDVHGDINYLKEVSKKCKREDPDMIICAGDVLNLWRYSSEIKKILQDFNKLTLLIHGNHENPQLIDKLCSNNIVNIHKKIFEFKKIKIFGYGGGGFEQEDKELELNINKVKDKLENWIFVTHAPPFNTNLDLVYDYHVGSKSIRKIIERFHPLINICGHLHENFEVTDKINKTKIINPGPLGTILEL